VGSEDSLFRLPASSRAHDLHGAFEILLRDADMWTDRNGDRRTLYSLRHTYATFQILLNRMDLHTLAKNMGTSVGMLEKHYSHLTPTLAALRIAGSNRHRQQTILERTHHGTNA
jgi:integrase